MKKILYVILHGSMNPERYFNVKETWGKDVDCLFYSDHEDAEKNIIKVSDRKDYWSNEPKHINSIIYVGNNINNYEWFFFCDDDTFVNTEKLNSLLDTFDKNKVHGEILRTNNYRGVPIPPPILEYCSGGAGYLIHSNNLKLISKEIKILNTGYSDVTLGLFLRELKIPVSNLELFRSQPPNFYNYTTEEIKNYITFHYIKSKEEMNKLLENIKQ
jgi:hypothetical protein